MLVCSSVCSLTQISSRHWTNGGPLSVNYSHKNSDNKELVLKSWRVFHEYLYAYYGILLDKQLQNLGTFTEKIMWQTKLDTTTVHNVTKSLVKVHTLSKFFETHLTNQRLKDCHLLLVWHKDHLTWIEVPCEYKILDKGTLYCMEQRESQDVHSQMSNFTHVPVIYQTEVISNHFLCFQGSLVSILMLCDDHIDCKYGDDEIICNKTEKDWQFLQLIDHSTQHSQPEVKVDGKTSISSCHSPDVKCLYEINDRYVHRTQKYCSSGKHLDFCADTFCNKSFKCPGFYCVPWRYICDGHWDCPAGDDEIDCFAKHKRAYFHCPNSSIFVLPSSICDFVFDCPDNSDEIFCDLKNAVCPKNCSCIFYSMLCSFSIPPFSTTVGSPHEFLHISGMYGMKQLSHFVNRFDRIQKLFLKNNNFQEFCMENVKLKWRLVCFVAPKNNISTLLGNCLDTFPHLTLLSFAENLISSLDCDTFSGLSSLKVIDISQNKLTKLSGCTFQKVSQLHHFSVSNNNLVSISKTLFNWNFENQVHVNASFYAFSCLDIVANITPENIWPHSCEAPLESLSIELTAWAIFLGGFITNVYPLFEHTAQTNTGYQSMIKTVCTSNLFRLAVLGELLSVNILYKSDFVFFEHEWKMSFLCHVLCFTILFSGPFSVFCFNLLTVSRYMVIKYPLDSKFKISSFVLKCIGLGLLCSTLLSVVFSMNIFLGKLYSPLCFPLGHTESHVLNYVITLLLAFFGLWSCLFVTCIYLALIFIMKKNSLVTSNQSTNLYSHFVKKSCITVFANFLSFLPSSVIFILTLVITKYPYEMLTWAFVAVIPANFIQVSVECIQVVLNTVRTLLTAPTYQEDQMSAEQKRNVAQSESQSLGANLGQAH